MADTLYTGNYSAAGPASRDCKAFLPARASKQGKVIGVGVHIIYIVDKKNLNRTLAIDSPFQTFAVGLLIAFID